MATLTGKITDVTGRAPDSISSITVKAPSARIGSGTGVIVSSPAEVTFDRTTGHITISGLTGGLSWLYIEGDGWSDSIALAVADGMATLVEAVANASGVPGLVDFIELLETLRQNMQDVVTDEFARNSTASVGYAANAGKSVQLDTEGKLNIATSQVTREQDAVSKGYVDQRVPITGTGSPEGKVAAPVGSVYTDTAATNGAIRWIKTSGTGAVGWRVEYGDTGWRNITPASITSGEMLIRRIGNTVMISLRKIVFTYQSLGSIPSGFHSPGIFIPAKPRNGIEFTLYVFTDENGYTAFTTPSPGDSSEMYGSATYFTNSSWPSTLPGTPA